MNCEAAREKLLDAELSELRAEGGGELARHLSACPECRERAQRILEQTAQLAAALERVVPPAPPDGLSQRAMEGDGGRWRPMRRWAVAVPLALAASLAVMLLRRPPSSPPPPDRSSRPPALATAPLDVKGPPGVSVAVFQTDNPNIVVIWHF